MEFFREYLMTSMEAGIDSLELRLNGIEDRLIRIENYVFGIDPPND